MADQEDQVSPSYTQDQMAAFEKYEKDLTDYNQQAKAFKEHQDAGYALYPHTGAAIGAAVPLAGAATNKISDLASKGFDALNRQPAASAGQRWAEAVGGPGGKTVDEAVRAREIQMGLKPGEKLLDGIVVDQATYDKEMADRAAKRAAQSTAKEATKGMNPKELDLLQRSGLLRKVLGGAGAGFDLGDAYRRYKTGDTRGAVISGLGALGYPISRIPYPPAEVAGYGLMFGAPALNQLLDKPEEKAKGGLAALKKAPSHFAKGGEAGVIADTLGAIQDAIQEAKALNTSQFTPRPTTNMKLSEALGSHEGKNLILTQSDNYGVHGGRRGGNQFSNFQNIEPLAQQENVVWMNDTPQHANSLIKLGGDKNIVVPYTGKQDQLKSNRSVHNEIMDAHYDRENYLKPEQFDLINNRIKTVKENGDLIFPQPFDIRDRFATQELGGDTFARRGVLSSLVGEGEGVGKTRNGIALPNYQEILQANRDPLTIGQPTTSVGSRLFTVDPTRPSQFDTRFNPNYNWTVYGNDLGVNVGFTPPQHAIPGYWNSYIQRTNRVPSGNGMFGYNKNPQEITHDYLMNLEKAGYAKGGEVGTGLDALSAITDAIKEAKATPPVNRIDMNFKDVTKRVPEVTDAFAKLTNGEIGHNEYEDLVNKYKPVTPFNFIPTPATREEAINSLRSNQKDLYGIPSQTLQEGHPVGLRLDIPAYRDYGTWVPTVHEQKSGFGAGPLIGHESVAHITDPTFGMSQEAAASIAGGKPKGTIATIKGNWKPTIADEAVAKGQEYLNNPDWIQVGMDPERHSYFYDRTTMEPVTHAEEALQIGPLVLAKKPKYGKKEDFKYADGGPIEFTNKYGTSVGQDQYGNQVLPQPTELDELKGMLPDRSTIQAIPKATSILGNKIAEEAKREWDKSGWRSIPDIALNTGAILGGSISDLASGFSPSLNKGEETNPLLGVGQEKEKPNFLGSEQIHDYLRNKGITKEDYPLAENALMLAAPYAGEIPGMISKGVRATEGLPVGMSIKDVSGASKAADFYNPLEQNVKQATTTPDTMQNDQWSNWLRSNKVSPGGRNEAEQSGLMDLLNNNPKGRTTKNDILNHIQSNDPNIKVMMKKELPEDKKYETIETVDGDYAVIAPNGRPEGRFNDYREASRYENSLNDNTIYSDWRTPGGKNYKEIVLSTPNKEISFDDYMKQHGKNFTNMSEEARDHWLTSYRNDKNTPAYKSRHWNDVDNPIVHLRMDDRINTDDGGKVLHIGESQSDWGQDARKYGLKGESNDKDAVSSGPYIGDTENWSKIGFKHALKHAVDNGYDYISWSNGDQQKQIYDLSKHLSDLHYSDNKLRGYDHDGSRVINETAEPHQLDKHIGKAAANKLLAQDPDEMGVKRLSGLDLKVGGEGMEGYYDKMYPNFANDVVKQLGVKPQTADLHFDIPNEYRHMESDRPEYDTKNLVRPAHTSTNKGIKITPELREAVLKNGIPKFKKGGKISKTQMRIELDNFKGKKYG